MTTHSKQNPTPQKLHTAIKRIMDKRSGEASKSQYDVSVCVSSVAAARRGFEAVPIEGTYVQYGNAVLAVLEKLADEFYDSDGEYTSKGMIGDVYLDVSCYIDSVLPDEFAHINKKEARRVLIEKSAAYIGDEPKSTRALKEASIRFTAKGKSGTLYYLEITYELTSETEFSMIGNIYDNDTYQSSIMEERWFLVDRDLIVDDKGFYALVRYTFTKVIEKIRLIWFHRAE